MNQNNKQQQQHAPSFVHATVHLRQTESDDKNSIALWKALFDRWEEIFSFSSNNDDDDISNANRNKNTNNNDEADEDEDDYNNESDGNDEDYYYDPPPPPGSILMRFLLCSGSVIPGTLTQCCPQFDYPNQGNNNNNSSTSKNSNATSTKHSGPWNPHNGSLSNNLTTSSDYFANTSSPAASASFFKVYQRFQQDHSLAAIGYAEWWRWVLMNKSSTTTSSDKSSSSSSSMNPLSRSKGSIHHNTNNSMSNNSSSSSWSSTSSSSFTTGKFLFSTAIKLGSLFQFVSLSGLQTIANCKKITAKTMARAQASLLATLTQLSSATPALPPPYLIAHLAGLAGATGEAFMDVHRGRGGAGGDNASSVDFFSFTVQKAMSTDFEFVERVKSNSSNNDNNNNITTERQQVEKIREHEVSLELKFLDIQQDTNNNNNASLSENLRDVENDDDDEEGANNRIRSRDVNDLESEKKLLKTPISSWSSSAQHQHQQQYQLFNPRWSYGCVRFTAIPTFVRAQNNAFATAMMMNTASVVSSLTSSVNNLTISAQPQTGTLRAPQYEEAFGIRYIILIAQRLVSLGCSSRNHDNPKLIRLATRLSFWASVAAASFPMESIISSSSSGSAQNNNNGHHQSNYNSSRFLHQKQQLMMMSRNNNNQSASSSSPVVNSLLSLVGLNRLVIIPCMSACLAMYCSLIMMKKKKSSASADQEGDMSSNNNNQDEEKDNNKSNNSTSSNTIEALLSVALAYSACTLAAKSASFSSTSTNGATNTAEHSTSTSAAAASSSRLYHNTNQEHSVRKAREAAIANLVKQTQKNNNTSESSTTKKRKTKNDAVDEKGKKQQQQQTLMNTNTSASADEEQHSSPSVINFSSAFLDYEDEIKSWRTMGAGERSALTLRHLILSMATQWIAAMPLKKLEFDIFGNNSNSRNNNNSISSSAVVDSLPLELKTVLDLKFNPGNKKLLSMMILSGKKSEGDDGDGKERDEDLTPKIFSFADAARLKRQKQQQQQQQQGGTTRDDANDEDGAGKRRIDFGQDENENNENDESFQDQAEKELLLMWAGLESCANEAI